MSKTIHYKGDIVKDPDGYLGVIDEVTVENDVEYVTVHYAYYVPDTTYRWDDVELI